MIRHDDPIHQKMLELAYDSVEPNARKSLLEKIAALPVQDQPDWHALIEEVDQLRSTMSKLELSNRLESKLLGIPNQNVTIDSSETHSRPANVYNFRSWTRTPIGRVILAACMLIGLSTALYLNWPYAEPVPDQVPPLAPMLAAQIASTAAKFDVEEPTLEIKTSDAQALLAHFEKRNLSFPPYILNAGPSYTLDGGGVVTFDGKPAVFTRWHSDSETFLLFQFDSKPLALPPTFPLAQVEENNCTIYIWPGAGGACGWALVSEKSGTNPFYGRMY